MKYPGKLFTILLSLSLLSGFLVMPLAKGLGKPHAINGFVRDLNSTPVRYAAVYVNNTRTSESLNQQTDEIGRYSIDIDGYPSGYENGDLLNVAAVYYQYSAEDNITVTPEPTQQMDITLIMRIHTIEGNIHRLDGSGARHYSVNITNQDKSEYLYTITDDDGHYRMDLSRYQNGYDLNDDITASVFFDGFSGSNSSIISSNHTDYIDVFLADIEPPALSVCESPTNITLDSFFRILAYVDDNTEMFSASLFIKSPGESIFTELTMIPDDGAGNDWDSDGMVDIQIFGQSTSRNIPQQSCIGIFEYYVKANDSVFTVTQPAVDPVNNAYEILVLDIIEPTLAHTPITTLEAGETMDTIVTADDNIGLDDIIMYVKGVGESVFTEYSMNFNGDPGKYNATMPAQFSLGILEYYVRCNDTSNNSARQPENGSWSVNVIDTTPPELTSVPINSVNVGSPITFDVLVYDAMGISDVEVQFNDVHGIIRNYTMQDQGAGIWSYTNLTGQNQTGILNYTFWVTDFSSVRTKYPAGEFDSYSVQINYVGTPLLFYDAPDYFDYNVSTNISVYVEDDGNISTVSLAYESVGATDFIIAPMNSWDTTGTQGNYSAEIPAQDLGTMRYYINATDGTKNITWPAIGPPHVVDVLDMELPAISPDVHIIIKTSPDEVIFLVNVTDNHSVDEVIIHYLNSTNQSWIPLHMVPVDVDLSGSGLYEGIIPGNVSEILGFYYFANDSSGNNITSPETTPKLNPYYLINLDYSSPDIEMYFPASTVVNSTTEIIINVTDDHEIVSAQLFFNGTEDGCFTLLTLSKLENGTYKGILPPQNLSGDIQIYARASDGANIHECQIFSIPVINLPPKIQHIGVGSAPVGENVAMVAQVNDDLHVENVILSWRPIDEILYSNLTMNQTVFGTYRADLSFEDAVIIQYYITAFDAENSTAWPDGPNHEISIMDLESPIIIHEPLLQFNVSSTSIFSASVSDNQQVSSVILWYKNASVSTFFSASMSPVSNHLDTYSVVLGPQPEGNFTYYIEASDGTNCAETLYYTLEVVDSSGTDWVSLIMLIIVMILLAIAAILILLFRRRKPIKQGVNPPEK